jgi:hypothetical protein
MRRSNPRPQRERPIMTKWKLVPESFVEFIKGVAQQEPEKPDYWSSCSQCQRNIDDAEELLEAAPQPPALTDERIMEIHREVLRGDAGGNRLQTVILMARAIERELLGGEQ